MRINLSRLQMVISLRALQMELYVQSYLLDCLAFCLFQISLFVLSMNRFYLCQDFGTVPIGAGNQIMHVFGIRSIGWGYVNLQSVTCVGANPGDFNISKPTKMGFDDQADPISQFTIQFQPTTAGTRSCDVQIA